MNTLFRKNLSWIFFGNIAHAVLQFLLNVICARAFGAQDYGLMNYGVSLVAFATAVCTLGIGSVITKFFAVDRQEAGELLGTGILARLLVSLGGILVLQAVISLDPEVDTRLRLVLLGQSVQILFASGDLLVYWFRFTNEAKTAAVLRLAAFFLSALWRIWAILYRHSITLYVLGVSLETAIFSVLLLLCFRRQYGAFRFRFRWDTLKRLMKPAYPFIVSALLITVYGQTDKIMLRAMVDHTAVGLYSVSMTLAGAISIIPTALIEGFRPDIMTQQVENPRRGRQRIQQLYGIVFWLCMAYGLFITVLAEPIIRIFYGAAYLDAVPSLSLVVWYTSFSYFGSIRNIQLVAEEKTGWVPVLVFSGAVVNVLLNLLLIPGLGIVGAALASLLTQFIANFLLPFLIPALRDTAWVVVEGIRLKGFLARSK